jgi:hypothetical protein
MVKRDHVMVGKYVSVFQPDLDQIVDDDSDMINGHGAEGVVVSMLDDDVLYLRRVSRPNSAPDNIPVYFLLSIRVLTMNPFGVKIFDTKADFDAHFRELEPVADLPKVHQFDRRKH